MQDIHSLVGGRMFGAATSGDRRLRPLQHHHHHHQQQALKCPRCDSLNTKFCYYNNYNLSQPRHFCKSCRRYWTKGGVLRNVPVGGGCRKNKRSKPKNNNPSTTPALSAGQQPQTAPPLPHPVAEEPPHPVEPKSSPHSSSESSSVTGTEAAAAAVGVSAPAPTSVSASEILGMSEFRSVVPASADPSVCSPVFEHALLEQLGTAGDNSVIFTESNGNGGGGGCGGGFTGLMMTSWNEPFSASSNAILLNNHQWFHEDKLPGITGGFLDQTVENRSGEGNGGFGALDWQPTGGDNDQGLFDLPNTVDQAYWSHTQWTDQDNTNLYLP